ncbi:MAG: sigma-70 family RNA polymerase sigma factor [Actinomycetota bacterium]|nr:sigma-70 family RNA polymerase sigma factor [Actinomycetota bacterium]
MIGPLRGPPPRPEYPVGRPATLRAAAGAAVGPLTERTSPTASADSRLAGASDAELATALRLSELVALEEVFRRHGTQVAATARRIAGGYHVDDVVQEVFLSLWRAPERFRPERGSLARYLVMLAHGKTIDAVRTEEAWRRRAGKLDRPAPTSNEVENAVMANVTAVELQTALRALPMTERVAIELAFFGGYTYRQVAAELGQPEGTIKSRIRSGLRRLEAALCPMRRPAFD